MNALDYNLSTIEPEGTESGFGLRSSEHYPALRRRYSKDLWIHNGLVVSGDDSVRRTLGETLLHCGVEPVFAATIEEAVPYVAQNYFRFVLCQDRLPDGTYEDMLRVQRSAELSFPLIVVSSTGDWPEFFKAVDIGAYDFLAYPLVLGELQRIIRDLLNERALVSPQPPIFSAASSLPRTASLAQTKNRRLLEMS